MVDLRQPVDIAGEALNARRSHSQGRQAVQRTARWYLGLWEQVQTTMLCVLLQGDPFRRLVWHTHPTARSLPSSGSGPMGSRPGARTPGLWEGARIALSLGRTLVISRSPSSPKSRSSAPSGSARSSSPRRAAFNISLTRSSNGAVARRCASVIALPETKLTVESRSEECEEVGKCVGGTCVGHSAHCARSASRREADAAARGEWRALVLAGGWRDE